MSLLTLCFFASCLIFISIHHFASLKSEALAAAIDKQVLIVKNTNHNIKNTRSILF